MTKTAAARTARRRKPAQETSAPHANPDILQVTHDLLHDILDHVADPIFVKDREHRLIYGNQALSEMIGLPREAYLGKCDLDFFPKEQVEVFWEKDNQVFDTGKTDLNEEYLTDSQGKLHVLSTKKTRCMIGEDAVIVGITRDITAIKEVEQLKNEFIAMISHELRTPLTSIHASLALLASGKLYDLPSAANGMVNIAYHNSERLVRLINEILDIEKIESGMMRPLISAIPLHVFLMQAIEENSAYGQKHGVMFALGSTPPDVCIFADPNRLMQVLANLLSNAAKFSPRGSRVTVSAAILDHAYTRLEVRDQGLGIPEKLHATLFDKFTQGDSSNTRQQGGTGLGLNITKQLVEAMQGRISFASRSGEGTSFYIDLPTAEAAPAANFRRQQHEAC